MAAEDRPSLSPSKPNGGSRRRRRRPDSGRRRYDDLLLGLLGVVACGSLLAIGAIHLESLVVVATIATLGAALAFASSRVERIPLPAAIAALLAAYSLLQALPLPLSWVGSLSPVAGDTWSRALRPFGEPALRFGALSLAPRSSLVEALKWWTYASVFVLAAAVHRTRGAKPGIVIVFLSGTLAAAVTLVHGVVGATELFGFYDPTFVPGRWTVGPLLNPNNLSGYLNLAAFCGVGLLLGSSIERYRYWIALGLMLLIATSLLAASRGGVLGLLVGSLLLLPAGLRMKRDRRPLPRRTLFALAGFSALGLVFALIGGTRETWRALYDANVSKLELAVWARPMIVDHPWFGVGRGAFETVLPAYHPVVGHVSYTNPENFIAQWTAEWGIVVTALALLGFGWAFRLSRLQVRRSMTAMSALVGAFALLFQNLVDLALEVPAVVIALVVVLTSVSKEPERSASESERPPARLVTATAVLGAALVIGTAIFGTRGIALVRLALHDRYQQLDVDNKPARAEFQGELRREVAVFPAEPYLPLLGALVAWKSNADPLPWLGRVLERDQAASRAHFLLASVLERRKATSQAVMELRLAMEADPDLTLRASQLAVDWTKDLDLLRRAIPADTLGVEPLVIMVKRLSGREHDELREALLSEALRRDPRSARVLSAQAAHLLEALAMDLPRCREAAHATCVATIRANQRLIQELEPDAFAAIEIEAKLLMSEGKADRAETMLAESCVISSRRVPCLRLRMLMALETKDHGRIVRAAKDYVGLGCVGLSECATANHWIGGLLSQRGLHSDGLGYLERAARDAPTIQNWLSVADTAEKAGATGRQINALRQAQQLPGGDASEVRRRLDRAMASSARILLQNSAPASGPP